MQSVASFMLFAGSSHEELAKKIAGELHIKLGEVRRETFPDGEIGIQILESVRGKDVFVLQSLARRPNHFLMELLIMVDALKRASARSISAVIPYYAYARQDRKDKPRMPITAKLVANLLEKAGVDRVLTMDLHTEQIQGFFDIPVDNLYARPLFVRTFQELGLSDLIVVAPDAGSNRMAKKFAEELGTDLAFVDKRRISGNRVETGAVIGDVSGNVLIVDDICATGETLKRTAEACIKYGAKRVIAAATHGLFLGDALKDSGIDCVYTTDTVPGVRKLPIALHCVSTAQLFAAAIDCVANAKSVSSLFKID
jgi:ribose-phosphate pyrophosphokinase